MNEKQVNPKGGGKNQAADENLVWPPTIDRDGLVNDTSYPPSRRPLLFRLIFTARTIGAGFLTAVALQVCNIIILGLIGISNPYINLSPFGHGAGPVIAVNDLSFVVLNFIVVIYTIRKRGISPPISLFLNGLIATSLIYECVIILSENGVIGNL